MCMGYYIILIVYLICVVDNIKMYRSQLQQQQTNKKSTMKSISTLLRTKPSIQHTYRRFFGNANMVKRKQLRRLKKINIYNREISGQSNTNLYFTPKKLRAMGNHIEMVKNNHIGFNPVSVQLQKQLLKTMPQLAQWQYYNFRNRNQQLIQMDQFTKLCDLENKIKQLPVKIRKQIQSAQQVKTPELAQPLLRYTEQLQVYLPKDQRYRYNLLLKLQHPPQNKLQSEEGAPQKV